MTLDEYIAALQALSDEGHGGLRVATYYNGPQKLVDPDKPTVEEFNTAHPKGEKWERYLELGFGL